MLLNRKNIKYLMLILGLLVAATSLSGCLWVGPGPGHHRGGGAVIIKPWNKPYYHRNDQPYRQSYEHRWQDNYRPDFHPRG